MVDVQSQTQLLQDKSDSKVSVALNYALKCYLSLPFGYGVRSRVYGNQSEAFQTKRTQTMGCSQHNAELGSPSACLALAFSDLDLLECSINSDYFAFGSYYYD